MSKAQCPKCGAGHGALELVKEPTVIGFERFIKCCQCGNRIYEPPKTVMQFDGRRKIVSEPCTGCGAKNVRMDLSSTGLCHRCTMKMETWYRGPQISPPPFIDIAGRHRPNPERISA